MVSLQPLDSAIVAWNQMDNLLTEWVWLHSYKTSFVDLDMWISWNFSMLGSFILLLISPSTF